MIVSSQTLFIIKTVAITIIRMSSIMRGQVSETSLIGVIKVPYPKVIKAMRIPPQIVNMNYVLWLKKLNFSLSNRVLLTIHSILETYFRMSMTPKSEFSYLCGQQPSLSD